MPDISTPIFGAIANITGPLTFVAFLVAAGLAYLTRNERIVAALTTRLGLDRRSYFRLMILGVLLIFALATFSLVLSMQASGIELYVLIGSALVLIALLVGFAAWLANDNPHAVRLSPTQTVPPKNNDYPSEIPPGGNGSARLEEKGEDDMSHKEDLQTLIQNHERRLQILKERQAIQGINTDPAILIEIEKIEAELVKLRAQIKVTITASPSSQRSQYVKLRSWLDNLEDTEFREMIRSLLTPSQQTRLTSPVQSINRGDFLGTMQRWDWLSRVEQYLCKTYPERFLSQLREKESKK